MAKYYVLTLTDEEHDSLTALVHQRRVASKRLVRAQCLLAVATNGLGWTDQQTESIKKCGAVAATSLLATTNCLLFDTRLIRLPHTF